MLFNILLTLFSAIIFGRMEQFTFNKGLHIGPPNFLGYFVAQYHLPIAFMAFCIMYGLGTLPMFPLWVWLEDMFYFIGNTQDKLDDDEWITGGYGGFSLFGQFIPWVYVALAIISSLSISLFM